MKIKILCVNIWRGNLYEALVEFLKKEDPDILLMQEVFNNQGEELDRTYRMYDLLKSTLSYEYGHFAPTFYEPTEDGKMDQGNAIMSKFPLEHMKTIFYDVPYGERPNDRKYFPQSPRNLQVVKIDVKGNGLYVANTQGIWGHDGYDSERRFEMFDKIKETVKDFKPLVLAGDFNLMDKTEAVLKLENYLKNIFKGELKTSFNLKHKDLTKYPGFVEAVVDMMFVSKDMKVLDHFVPDVDVSDHLPLVGIFEI